MYLCQLSLIKKCENPNSQNFTLQIKYFKHHDRDMFLHPLTLLIITLIDFSMMYLLTQAVFESEGSKVRKRASVLLFDKKFSKPYIQVFEPILFEKLMKKVVSSLQFSETHSRKRRVCAFAASYLTRNISNFSSCVLLE